ncbi:Uncharacterised protein [Actinobaculum suis]|uniref:Uncharacterized protein n=1 Tax=Actinobaculum suis TaxID=1657 RepID=A0A0K9ET08_9ACTO|nr:hypothetical protein [Actinobaculum suis]KMY23318.1 hypothetical protein ACU19_04930 [Actinobaculum suis]VDG77352.1 Uncharacterised protein [Actinobaculum suis]
MSSKLVNTDIVRIVAVVGGLRDQAKPTVSELEGAVDITCAIASGYTLGMNASETIQGTQTLCEKAASTRRGPANYAGEFTFVREGDRNAQDTTSAFLKAAKVFKDPDTRVDIVRRGGVATAPDSALPYTEKFAEGQTVEVFGFTTDYPQNRPDQNGEDATYTVALLPTGQFEHAVKVTAG